MKYHYYAPIVVDAIINYHKENFGENLTKTDVYLMQPYDILAEYLNWEGILGYTWIIENILVSHEIEEDKEE